MENDHLRHHPPTPEWKIPLIFYRFFFDVFPKKVMKILSVLLIILTILYFTCFGSFLVLNDTVAQTVTLSSEGAAIETYPDSMGEYQQIESDDDGSLTVYRHVEREDRFLLYNNLGNIRFCLF